MDKLKKVGSILVYSIPIDIFVIGSMIKGVSVEHAGLLMFGFVIALIGFLYIFLGCDKEKRLPIGITLAGVVLTICSFLAIVLGIVAIATPICYLGGKKLWNLSKQ